MLILLSDFFTTTLALVPVNLITELFEVVNRPTQESQSATETDV
jgi:hypothetical protein